MKYRLEPGAEVSTAVDGGDELRLVFDKDGICEVPDDFQEATRVLDQIAKRVKDKS